MKPWRKNQQVPQGNLAYPRFDLINGNHDFKKAVPGGYVEYAVRTRRGGKVAYFNFKLAKEMGLIPKNHPHEMNPQLHKRILDTFCLQIINEYDLIHETQFPKKDIRPNKYMATRYLQLQHPDKRGTTSGDGRSIWNGQIEHGGTTWDVSSCGTGATCLSPATAIERKFFKTGDPKVCYGCGYADLTEGLSAAIMSETFHKNGIATERSLACIEFPNNGSINVRASPNLIRPSHFFNHLKQGKYERLKNAIDYHIKRQISNGLWPDHKSASKRYEMMAEEIAKTFARMAAQLESDYVFLWLDWDGDNVLADGGIIDYGSVRQFGLYHHEYRYDDVDRMSTTIPEQKKQARYIVQTFVQIKNFLITKKKVGIAKFKNDPVLKLFDAEFERQLNKNILYKIGFNKEQRTYLLRSHLDKVKKFKKVHSFFEKAKSSRGSYATTDGHTWDAIYCMRDILRELPIHLLNKKTSPTPEEFMKIIASSYAARRDRTLTRHKVRQIYKFLKCYMALLDQIRRHFKTPPDRILLEITMRSSLINRYDRITGDSIICVTEQIIRDKKGLSFNQVQKIIEDFIDYQKLRPSPVRTKFELINATEKRAEEKVKTKILNLVREHRESL